MGEIRVGVYIKSGFKFLTIKTAIIIMLCKI